MTHCERCGRDGLHPAEGSADARLLRHAKQGYCVDCAATDFLKTTAPLNQLIDQRGVGVLGDPIIQRQFAAILASGKADADPAEIDWSRVLENWDLPLTAAAEKEIARQRREW